MKLLRYVFNRRVMAVLGLIALALLIWYAGPTISIAGWHPLDPPWVRAAIIAAILLFYVGRWLWQLIAAKRANTQLAQALVDSPLARGPAPAPGSEEVAELRRRFEEAIAVLKTTKQRKSGKASTLFSGQFLYDLPWYMFIGAPGSGKTTALIHSGLHFPLAERFGHELAGVGGTRNCDWYFTDQAVLIDTAGRYTTQESDRETDHGAWTGFLKLLTKYRPRRPINGAIVTVSVADLLQLRPAELDAQARAVRARIQELHEQLNVRFPLYVMVSKADLLPGFMDFFAEYGREEREQVWGTTLPLLEGGGDVLADFEARFKALEERLNERLISRLQQERDPQTRASIYAFPQHFSALKEPLHAFLRNVFTPTRFEEQPLVRGVYFTSGTQEGSPIDRIMGGLARAFKLERKLLAPQHATGKSFFITHLFTGVMFPEANIAGTNLRWERRRLAVQWAGIAAAALVTLGLIAAWTISYARNHAYILEVREKLEGVTAQLATLRAAQRHELVELLPPFRAVQTLAVSDSVVGGVPISMKFGLYQGGTLQAASDAAYEKMLRDVFLPRVAMRIEDQLRSGQQNLELLYEALKAYIMLTDQQRFDKTALKAFVTAEWKSNMPREVTVDQLKELEGHLDALLARGGMSMPIRPDNELIASARATISRIPTAQRVYNRIKLQHASPDLPEFTLVRAGGDSALLVFRRASGEPPTRGVPGFFSFDVYHKVFNKAAEHVTTQFAQEETWVLGLQQNAASRLDDSAARERLTNDVRRLYLEEYRNVWDRFVNDIKLVPVRDLHQTIALTSILSSPESPMHLLLNAIVRETTLGEEKAEKSVVETATDTLRKRRDDLTKIFAPADRRSAAPSSHTRLESIVDDHFANLRRQVRPAVPGQPPPIDTAAALMKDAHTHLVTVQAALNARTQPPPSDVPNRIRAEAGRLPEPLRSTLGGIAAAAGRQVAHKARETLSESLATSMAFCKQAVDGRYPFVRTSRLDVTRDDFARLFAPGGLLDDFFQKNLAPHVDATTRPWRLRTIGDPTISEAAASLVQFQRAQTIREVFFHGTTTPSLRLEFKPVSLDASITHLVIDFDGQILRYSHGPQIPTMVQWPGTKGTSQIRIEISPPGPSGSASGQVFDGPWALLRMLDRGHLQPTSHPDKMLATWNIDGRTIQFEIRSASVQNPVHLGELQHFRCPSRL